MSRYYKLAQREHSTGAQIAATLAAGVVFVILLPLVIARVGPILDQLLGLPQVYAGPVNWILGGILVGVGLSFGVWVGFLQLSRGRGTPLPLLPTQELLTQGPFRYCRNPMTFGTILFYLGVGIAVGTIAGIGMVLCFAIALVFYLKHFEERELAERFGDAYLSYKQAVPFIIPRPPKRQ